MNTRGLTDNPNMSRSTPGSYDSRKGIEQVLEFIIRVLGWCEPYELNAYDFTCWWMLDPEAGEPYIEIKFLDSPQRYGFAGKNALIVKRAGGWVSDRGFLVGAWWKGGILDIRPPTTH